MTKLTAPRMSTPSYGPGFDSLSNRAKPRAFPEWYQRRALTACVGSASDR